MYEVLQVSELFRKIGSKRAKGVFTMSCKTILSKPLICSVALGILALAPLTAKAQGDMSSTTTTTSSMSTTSMSSTPMMVTGTVLRYYTDREGYVTAMDVQTADGVKFVRFSPSMGQRLYTTYPVGGTATVYVSGDRHPEVVSVGATMPTPGMMMTSSPSDMDELDSVPYIMSGAKLMKVSGTLKGIVTNDTGEVVGLVIKDGDKAMSGNMNNMSSSMSGSGTSGSGAGSAGTTTMPMTTSDSSMSGNSMMPMTMAGTTLVRVPREFRSLAPGYNGTERVTPLFKGADVEVTGYPEAPRYGVMSVFENRIAANAIVVNGRTVGALGFQRLMLSKKERHMGMMNSMGMEERSRDSSMNADEMSASNMGYTSYGMDTSMSTPTTTSSTTTTTTTTDSSTTTTTPR